MSYPLVNWQRIGKSAIYRLFTCKSGGIPVFFNYSICSWVGWSHHINAQLTLLLSSVPLKIQWWSSSFDMNLFHPSLFSAHPFKWSCNQIRIRVHSNPIFMSQASALKPIENPPETSPAEKREIWHLRRRPLPAWRDVVGFEPVLGDGLGHRYAPAGMLSDMLYLLTWIPSIYPLYVRIYSSTMDPCWDTLKRLSDMGWPDQQHSQQLHGGMKWRSAKPMVFRKNSVVPFDFP